MKKIFTQQFIGVLGILCSLILSITLYAYKSDQNHIEEKIQTETIERKNADTQLRYNFEKSMQDHNTNVHQALTNEIKAVTESNIRTEEKIDKILFLLAKDR